MQKWLRLFFRIFTSEFWAKKEKGIGYRKHLGVAAYDATCWQEMVAIATGTEPDKVS